MVYCKFDCFGGVAYVVALEEKLMILSCLRQFITISLSVVRYSLNTLLALITEFTPQHKFLNYIALVFQESSAQLEMGVAFGIEPPKEQVLPLRKI